MKSQKKHMYLRSKQGEGTYEMKLNEICAIHFIRYIHLLTNT